MLLCLAARHEYFAKIHDDRRLAICFVKEVLRLYPPFRQFGYERKGIWSNPELSQSEATDFMVSVFALHRNQSAWKNPEVFCPERFLEPNTSSGAKSLLPFGMGTRACPGRSYSLKLMVAILSYVCSEHFTVWFGLPADYQGGVGRMPTGAAGRLVSFPIDDRLTYRHSRSGESSHAS
jgi:cytochrome P450